MLTMQELYAAYPNKDLPYDVRPEDTRETFLDRCEDIPGDGLFLFLVSELTNDAENETELIERCNRAIANIEAVRAVLVKRQAHPTEDEARELAEYFTDDCDVQDVLWRLTERWIDDLRNFPDFYQYIVEEKATQDVWLAEEGLLQ